jgi:hypothetical protein
MTNKFLTREEVDKLLGVDPNERVATHDERLRLNAEIERVAKERHVLPEQLTLEEMNQILTNLGMQHVKLYSKEEIEKL